MGFPSPCFVNTLLVHRSPNEVSLLAEANTPTDRCYDFINQVM